MHACYRIDIADSNLSDPRLRPLPKCDRLAIGSSWRGNDLFLSVDGSAYAAIWDSKGICRRSISSARGDTAIRKRRLDLIPRSIGGLGKTVQEDDRRTLYRVRAWDAR
jgi:hypothetical protein